MSEHIFRAYDIRGIYGSEIDLDLAYKIGRAFGTKLILEQKYITIVGYDNRSSSVDIYNSLSKGIIDSGVDVINIGLVTTPMYYFALHMFKATSGVMITASHNPKEYNGFKISFNGKYNAYGEQIQEFKEMVKKGEFKNGKGTIITQNIKERYISFTLASIRLGSRKLKVVIDSGNGTSSIVVKDIFDLMDLDYIPLFTESDPNFPNHHPDPSVRENTKDLSETVIKEKADVGFAYDGDADRIGVVDEKGELIPIDKYMIIILRNILNKLDDKRILYDVKCSKALEDEIDKLGGIKLCSRTGNSYLRAKIETEKIEFGGELSGHVFFNDRFPGYDDGIYASLRLIEILSNTDKKVSELLDGIELYHSTDEIKMEINENKKQFLIRNLIEYCKEKKYNYLDIDGCKVIFDDGFALVRPSNTGPNITLRFEAKTENRLQEIQKEFENKIKEILN
ncbi:MAG: phosphomannomutase/phosphoglucomutase [Tenericutes bacterium]|nr:phosphomannomutase/phosphoglucomutase [Bacilli bacterium]NLV90267.1 phosphomannomutase/phosphoglucomutase [Mycoplasmatota bacterium]